MTATVNVLICNSWFVYFLPTMWNFLKYDCQNRQKQNLTKTDGHKILIICIWCYTLQTKKKRIFKTGLLERNLRLAVKRKTVVRPLETIRHKIYLQCNTFPTNSPPRGYAPELITTKSNTTWPPGLTSCSRLLISITWFQVGGPLWPWFAHF